MIYKCPHDLALRWRKLDRQLVFYEDRSGATHLLDEVSGRILQLIYHNPMDRADLMQLVIRETGAESVDDANGFLDSLILSLTNLELLDKPDGVAGGVT